MADRLKWTTGGAAAEAAALGGAIAITANEGWTEGAQVVGLSAAAQIGMELYAAKDVDDAMTHKAAGFLGPIVSMGMQAAFEAPQAASAGHWLAWVGAGVKIVLGGLTARATHDASTTARAAATQVH